MPSTQVLARQTDRQTTDASSHVQTSESHVDAAGRPRSQPLLHSARTQCPQPPACGSAVGALGAAGCAAGTLGSVRQLPLGHT